MEITVQELAALDPKGYVLLDMRGSEAREYGSIPGSVGVSPEELSRYNGDRGKKVIIYCARGQVSLDAAIALRAWKSACACSPSYPWTRYALFAPRAAPR